MRVLVNALSVSAPSGRHVLYGHLRQLAAAGAGRHEFVVLALPGASHPAGLDRSNIEWVDAPGISRNWLLRSAWESREMRTLIERRHIDLYFTPSGTVLPRCEIPQVSLAQNPWCLIPNLHRGVGERLKAGLQRRAYRQAFRDAALMVYNSEHMRRLYRQNAPGDAEGSSLVAHQAIDEGTHERAASLRHVGRPRPGTILSVSVMAHWKGAQILVRALKLLHRRGIRARLRFVGPWPDSAYAAHVRREINSSQLTDFVDITGHVPVERLHELYAEARVFCLMSRCESFGIPAVEAQAFGTPVVGSDTTAMPEIGADGGVYGSPCDPEATANLLAPLLTDDAHWESMSGAAVKNADRFRWSACSRPLLRMFDLDLRKPMQRPVACAAAGGA